MNLLQQTSLSAQSPEYVKWKRWILNSTIIELKILLSCKGRRRPQ